MMIHGITIHDDLVPLIVAILLYQGLIFPKMVGVEKNQLKSKMVYHTP